MCVSRRKAGTLNTDLASNACRTRLFVLVNDFNVYQHLLLIFVAVSVIELIFVQQCFILFVKLVTLNEASHIKSVVVNLASPDVS